VALMLAAGDLRLLSPIGAACQICSTVAPRADRGVPCLLPVVDAHFDRTGPLKPRAAAALLRLACSPSTRACRGMGAPIAWVGRLGLAADPAQALPKPFYLRAPDARPQAHGQLPRR
jgi:hypothetical protein